MGIIEAKSDSRRSPEDTRGGGRWKAAAKSSANCNHSNPLALFSANMIFLYVQGKDNDYIAPSRCVLFESQKQVIYLATDLSTQLSL